MEFATIGMVTTHKKNYIKQLINNLKNKAL